MDGFGNILVVAGPAKDSRTGLRCGISLARKFRASLSVVYLVGRNPFELSGGELPVDTIEHDYAAYQEEAKTSLAELLAEEDRQGLPIRELTRYGNPAKEIVRLVGEEKFDLIVLTAREEGRLELHVADADREHLIRKMPCSILLAKDGGDRPS